MKNISAETFANQVSEEFALTVSGYADYTERTKEIIANIVAGAPTLQHLVPMTGIKANHTVQLNILSTNVTWTNDDCVATETGNKTIVLAPRNVVAKRLSDRELICLDVLDAKLPMIQKASAMNTELPFADLYINLKVANNSKQLEKLVWQGDTTIVGATNNLNKSNGYLKIADGETGSLAGYDTFSTFTVSNAIATVRAMFAVRSEAMYDMEDLVLYIDQPKYDILCHALSIEYGNGTGVYVSAGDENKDGHREFKFPGLNITVRSTHGLNGNGSLFLTNESNLRYVTDMEADREKVELFYDKYHKQLVSDLVFTIGFQYEFPENVVYYQYVV